MKICFIPIDNRPVCYSLAQDICAIDEDIELFIPPRELLGGLTKSANINAIYDWLANLPKADVMVLSLDTLAYGGLIPSRRTTDDYERIKSRVEKLKPIIRGKKVYAFSSIMRISNNNCNEEEKEYWKDWGKKIFEYSYNLCKYKQKPDTDIPSNILEDYLNTRKRNFGINALYLDWQQNEGLFDTLIFSKDDCAQYGFNVSEAIMLQNWGGITKTGADEIPLTLLARAIEKDIKIFPKFIEPEFVDRISNYEDVSIKESVEGQIILSGMSIAQTQEDADIVLIVNNFKEKQGELVMGWETEPYSWGFTSPSKQYAAADVRYANGADNSFVNELFNHLPLPQYGYSAWNTSANTLGSLLAGIKVKYQAKKYNDIAYKKLQAIRYLDDWAYQANVRGQIKEPCDIKILMKPYEDVVSAVLQYYPEKIDYTYPWNRKFEVEVNIK